MNRDEMIGLIGELDVHRLQKRIDQVGYGPIPVALGDLFAAGCYFFKKGKPDLGQKLCSTALQAYGLDTSIVHRILRYVEENAEEMADLLNPHIEVPGWLFDE